MRRQPQGISSTNATPPPLPDLEARRQRVYDELHALGSASVPALARALRDPDPEMRRDVAVALDVVGGGWWHFPDGDPKLDLRPALPALLSALQDVPRPWREGLGRSGHQRHRLRRGDGGTGPSRGTALTRSRGAQPSTPSGRSDRPREPRCPTCGAPSPIRAQRFDRLPAMRSHESIAPPPSSEFPLGAQPQARALVDPRDHRHVPQTLLATRLRLAVVPHAVSKVVRLQRELTWAHGSDPVDRSSLRSRAAPSGACRRS